MGRGWHQEKWDKRPVPNVNGFPVHDELSKASPNNPVMLTHASGHASFVNQAALTAAGVTRDTPNPAGGTGNSAGGFGHPTCLNTAGSATLPAVQP